MSAMSLRLAAVAMGALSAMLIASVASAQTASTDGDGSADFRSQVDVSVRLSLSDHVSLETKAAAFEGEDPHFADRTKFWFAVEYRY